MPNLVVYVPADVARALEVKGVSENVQRRACKEVLAGLADGGLGAGEPQAVVASAAEGAGSVQSSPVSRRSSPAPSPSRKCGADVARGTRCKLCGEKH